MKDLVEITHIKDSYASMKIYKRCAAFCGYTRVRIPQYAVTQASVAAYCGSLK